MIIIIPLGGQGQRFKKAGYYTPKPLIKVFGKEIIFWLLDSLQLKNHVIIMPYNQELEYYNFEDRIKHKYPSIDIFFYKLNSNTQGAAESILLSLQNYPKNIDTNIICLDGDNFYDIDIIDYCYKSQNKNTVICFNDETIEPIYSYVKIDGKNITNIVEKEKISNYACSGCYTFENGNILKQYLKKIIDNNITQKNEFYTSGVIKEMIMDGIQFSPLIIKKENFICLGTPIQVRLFCNNFPRINAIKNTIEIEPKRICFDLDNTLVTYPKIHNDYTSVEPIQKNINFAKYLKKLGNIIIIHTARRMKTHHGNIGKLTMDIGYITLDTIKKYNIPCDELYFGKPYADVYIDDNAVSAYSDLEKELGYYDSMIDPRSFNSIEEKSLPIIRKKSDDLKGEIQWYLNIPSTIKDMFPLLVNYDTENYKWYDMEKLNTITISQMYLSGELTIDILDHIIGSITRIHNSVEQPVICIDIYLNYCNKMKKRYDNYDYSQFTNSNVIYNKIMTKLGEYEKNNCGHITPIHGDTVLTNIMINQFSKIKFIDMRGKVGDVITIYGDMYYDWAKLYQSLIGYDEILQDHNVNIEYKRNLIKHFESFIMAKFGQEKINHIKYITASLLFTLIPLHNNSKCSKYYDLISTIINIDD